MQRLWTEHELRAEAGSATPDVSGELHLSLLGGFGLRYQDEPVELPLSAQRVVAFLALHERPLLRNYVAGRLWLDASEERSAASLRSALWRLRRPGHPLVDVDAGHVVLAPDVAVDVREAMRLARRVLDTPGSCRPEELDPTVLTGELLVDWYDDWVVMERERLRQVCLHALEAISNLLMAAGRYGRAVEAALAAIQAEPLRESAHRTLIRAHLTEGNRSEAIRQCNAYRDLLRVELGVEPSTRFTELMKPLMAQ